MRSGSEELSIALVVLLGYGSDDPSQSTTTDGRELNWSSVLLGQVDFVYGKSTKLHPIDTDHNHGLGSDSEHANEFNLGIVLIDISNPYSHR